ncbi:DEAD/DEAH box helicase family protein [Candidatus Saccharibacteria bacterium]|nr:DEAD/DEAH box helicase family protein [Candidatus Saccharibacteria bacterium]
MSPELKNGDKQERPKQEIVGGIAARVVADEVEVSEDPTVALLTDIQKEHPEIEMRKYQADCLTILAHTRTGEDRKKALIHMATGLGKTTVVAVDVKRYLEENPGARVLFLCHQNQILQQARERFEFILGHDDYTYGNFTGVSKAMHEVTCLFGSFQTMKNWRQYFSSDEFDYVVVDESHHAKAETYEPTLKYFRPKFLLGMTATPDRQDLREIRDIFGHEKYSKNLAQALAEGLLARPDYRVILDDIQQDILRGVLERENVSLADINRAIFLPKRDEEIARIISERTVDIQNPKTIVFCPSIAHAHRMAELLPRSATYHSDMTLDERKEALRRFTSDQLESLVTVDMFNEGMDIADANTIVFLRSTQSETIFLQQLGRGLRKLPGKDSILVLDFVANCDRLVMIEKLLRETISSYRSGREPAEAIGVVDGEIEEDEEEIDIYDLSFDAVTQELETARELGLGNFEFTETTRKILEIVRRIQSTFYESAPDGWMSVRRFALENSISRPLIYRAMEELDIKPTKLKFGGKVGDALSDDQIKKLLDYPLLQAPPLPEVWKTLREFAEKNGVTYSLIYRLLGELGITLPIHKVNGIRAQSLSPDLEVKLLEYSEINVGPPPEGWVSVNELADKLGVSPTTVRKVIDDLSMDLPRFKFGPKISVGLGTNEQQAVVDAMPGMKLEDIPDGYNTIPSLRRELKVGEVTILSALDELGVIPTKHRVKGRVALTLSPEIKERLRQHPKLSVDQAPEGWVSVYNFATRNNVSKDTVEKIAAEIGVQLESYKFATRTSSGISPVDRLRILEVIKSRKGTQE